jgi:hypothetical protein
MKLNPPTQLLFSAPLNIPADLLPFTAPASIMPWSSSNRELRPS